MNHGTPLQRLELVAEEIIRPGRRGESTQGEQKSGPLTLAHSSAVIERPLAVIPLGFEFWVEFGRKVTALIFLLPQGRLNCQ